MSNFKVQGSDEIQSSNVKTLEENRFDIKSLRHLFGICLPAGRQEL
jgi:hypothetical protein